MPAPIVPVVTAAVARLVAKHGAKAVQKAVSKFPTSNVKKLPRKTAPKSGLETRGQKLSPSQRTARDKGVISDKRFSRAEGRYDMGPSSAKSPYYGTRLKSSGTSARKKIARENKVLNKPSVKKMKGK
jgi:hypothetical protein